MSDRCLSNASEKPWRCHICALEAPGASEVRQRCLIHRIIKELLEMSMSEVCTDAYSTNVYPSLVWFLKDGLKPHIIRRKPPE